MPTKPFKNLLDRFNASAAQLYGAESTRDRTTSTKNTQPFIEIKPNDPNKPDLGSDTLAAPLNSIAMDYTRLSRWSTQPYGLKWYLDQQNLQSGNTFGETRIINPTFVLGNVQPFVHLQRPLGEASGLEVSGDMSQISAGDTNDIGAAGRLQVETSKHILKIITAGGRNNLYESIIKLIPPTQLIATIGGSISALNSGVLGINQRPEMDMNGQGTYDSLYSIAIWNGFQKAQPPADQLERVVTSLRMGNLGGAVNAAINAVGDLANQVSQTVDSVSNTVSNIFGRRNRLFSTNNIQGASALSRASTTTRAEGWRYFITDMNNADRYLEGTVDVGRDGSPHASLGFLNTPPALFQSGIETIYETPLPSPTGSTTPLGVTNGARTALDGAVQAASDVASATQMAIARWPDILSNISISQARQVTGQSKEKQISESLLANTSSPTTIENPAEDAMKFGGLSLDQRYQTDDRLKFIRDNLPLQISSWINTIPTPRLGYGGGVSVGKIQTPDPNIKYQFGEKHSDGLNHYYYDTTQASPDNAFQNIGGTDVGVSTINANRAIAQELVDLYFFDYVNGIAIPFRAYLQSINETVTPEYSDVMYIGRSERNIIYIGARREVSFGLKVYAFNNIELLTIWKKINYLTSLCFPADFSNGFMVPPLVKLTLGDIYNNQPGYIRALTNVIEDDTPWEITPGIQAPHGVLMHISFAIIEKRQMSAAQQSIFYNFNQPRSTGTTPQTVASPASTDGTPVPGSTPGANRIGSSINSIDTDAQSLLIMSEGVGPQSW